MRTFFLLVLTAMIFVGSGSLVAAPIHSGPQTGTKVPGPFHPLNVTGPSAGERACLYCRFGGSPVAMIFAREYSPAVVNLITRIDAASRENSRLNSCAIFLGDSEKLVGPLKQTADRQHIQKTVLAVMNAPPAKYEIAGDAAVTVLLYAHGTVKGNHAYRAGELNEQEISAVLADLAAMLQK